MRLLGPPLVRLDEQLPLDAVLDEAFVPLRARTSPVGPARVRAAVRWAAPEPRPLRGLALLGRLSELGVAAAIAAFLFTGAVTSVESAPAAPDLSRDAAAAGEWTLNGRNALQRPMDSRAADYRTTAGDFAANAALARHPQQSAASQAVRDSEPFADRP